MACGIGCVEKLAVLSDRCALSRHGCSFGYKIHSEVCLSIEIYLVYSKPVKEKRMRLISALVKVCYNLVGGAAEGWGSGERRAA
jgi:hypothetical protein